MKIADPIKVHDQEAARYDKQVRECNSYSHDILFGMSFEYVKPHDILLDLGVGTGLASSPFAQMGLTVYGCDGSPEMLKICESKGFAKELKLIDFNEAPLPYSDHFFSHVICCGVLHFFSDLVAILNEVQRVIKPGGIFAFTVAAQTSNDKGAKSHEPQKYLEAPTPWGVSIFKHSGQYIAQTLSATDIEILKTQQLAMQGWDGDNRENLLFNALVTRRKNPPDLLYCNEDVKKRDDRG